MTAQVVPPHGIPTSRRWALVVRFTRTGAGNLTLQAIAYGARRTTGTTASVYQLAHTRLSPPPAPRR